MQSPGPRPFRALVVDFGGVLTTPLLDAIVRFANDLGIDLHDFARLALAPYAGGDDDLITGFETGRVSEEDFASAFADRLSRLCGRRVEPEGLVRRMFSGVELEDSMVNAVQAARRAGVKTGLLSNSWGLSLYPRQRLAELLDVVVISGEVGLRKPDPAIFRLILDELDVAAEECVYVDDHAGHLDAARGLGMATLLHTSPSATILELEALLGVPLSDRPGQ